MSSDRLEQALPATVNCIAVLGDSSSTGFGTGKRSYAVLVGEALHANRVENLAKFGQTTRLMVEEDLPQLVALQPDLVIVQAGMGDSLPHPGERVQRLLERFVPSTWHGVDGLERRAYYSGTRLRRARQWAVAESKTALKRILISLTGGFTRSNPDEFGASLDELLTGLEAMGSIVVNVGLFDMDQHVFPKQNDVLVPFRTQRERVLAGHPDVVRAEIDQYLHRWDDFLGDHGHWNASGHATVAASILRSLQSTMPQLVTASLHAS
jgi:lysophospholipase L1-like esterase